VQAISESWVRFAAMTPAQIKTYVASGEPMGKAGAYGVQGLAAAHIEQIKGSYSGIMGLPLFETASLLRAVGVRC
jgi:septum formation protein